MAQERQAQYKSFKEYNGQKALQDVDVKNRKLVGYFGVFGNEDRGRDITQKGAFSKSIQERGVNGTNDIKLLYQHDKKSPLGKPEELYEDNYGLKHVTPVSDTTLGRDVLKLAEDGVLDSFSYGYFIQKAEDRSGGGKLLKEVYLIEGSIVTFPMNEMAKLEEIKSKAEQIENFCRNTDASDSTIKILLGFVKELKMFTTEPETSTQPEAVINQFSLTI